MDLRQQFELAHAEHANILQSLTAWENALNLLSSDDYDTRCLGLSQLRALDGRIAEICEHCRREEEDPNSPLSQFAEPADRERMKDEHFGLNRANYEFRRDLEFTTASFTYDLVLRGQELLTALLDHIAYEEGLLRQFEAEHLQLAEAAVQS